MATTISDGTTSLSPLLITGWQSTRKSGNVLHDIVGASTVEATLREAGLRAGTLTLLCATLDAALAIEALASQAKDLSLDDDDHPALAMDFVAAGSIVVQIDEDTRELWTVAIDFQEIA